MAREATSSPTQDMIGAFKSQLQQKYENTTTPCQFLPTRTKASNIVECIRIKSELNSSGPIDYEMKNSWLE